MLIAVVLASQNGPLFTLFDPASVPHFFDNPSLDGQQYTYVPSAEAKMID
jgi:hypothetical protein